MSSTGKTKRQNQLNPSNSEESHVVFPSADIPNLTADGSPKKDPKEKKVTILLGSSSITVSQFDEDLWEEEDDEGLWEAANDGYLWGEGDQDFRTGIPTVVVSKHEPPRVVYSAEKFSFLRSRKERINEDQKEITKKVIEQQARDMQRQKLLDQQ